jgi:hypothetical protein
MILGPMGVIIFKSSRINWYLNQNYSVIVEFWTALINEFFTRVEAFTKNLLRKKLYFVTHSDY